VYTGFTQVGVFIYAGGTKRKEEVSTLQIS